MPDLKLILEAGALGVLALAMVGVYRFMMRLFEHRKAQDVILNKQVENNAKMAAELNTIKTLMIHAGLADKRDFLRQENEKME